MGAAQFKLSFLLSGSIIGTFLFFKSFMNNKVKVVSLGVFLLIIFFIPTSIWNYNQLDNFIFQNIFTTMPIEAIESLQEYRENFNYIYPFNLIFPNSISAISSILGFQFLILFIIFKNKKKQIFFVIYNYFNNYSALLS